MHVFLTKTASKIRLAKYVILGHILEHILVTFRAHLLPKTSKKHVKIKSVFELFFGVILGSFLVPFWRPNGTQMPLDGLLGHPVGPLRFHKGS